MCVVWKFQDEDSENSPLRKTAAHLSGRAARLSALPAARSCPPPRTRRASYPPRLVSAALCTRTPPPLPHSAPAASRCSLPLCPARRCVPLAACTRSPHPPHPAAFLRLPPPAVPLFAPPLVPAALPSAPAAVIFRAAAPRFRNKSVSLSPYCAPPARQWLRPADPARRPDPAFGGRPGLCRCLRAEPSGGRSGLRRAPGRTPTSDP